MSDGGKVESKRPADSAFQQQRLKAWQPLLTPKYVIGTFFLIGCIFVPIGVVVLNESNSVVEIKERYDHKHPATGETAPLVIDIKEDMKLPVYFYYQLVNFYQNHRRYVKSRSDKQLRGETGDTSSCDPLETYDSDKILYPCGLIASSFFNDSFAATYFPKGQEDSTERYELSDDAWSIKDISWKSDRDDKFKPLKDDDLRANYNLEGPNNPWNGAKPDVTSEHFIVWMRTAALPTFKKLNHVIRAGDPFTDGDKLKAGSQLVINITSNYAVDKFSGEKWVVLSTTSWLGGKNDFLGQAYITVGALCLVLAIGFLIKQYVSPRKLGDMQYFNWPGAAKGAQPVIGDQ